MSDSTPTPRASADDTLRGRRDVLSKAAIVAAVTTVAGLSAAKQAGAANSDPILIGTANSGTNATSIGGGSSLLVTDGNTASLLGKLGSIYGRQTISNRAGVMGATDGTSGGWAVYGRNSGSSGRGVYGLNVGSSGVGVYGEHVAASTEGGTGVIGVSNTGVGVFGNGGSYDLQAGGSGRVILSGNGVANPPTSGTVGTLAKDAAGNMWVCVATGSPGTWRKIAGVGTAGAFHALSPGRVYDSRAAAPTPGTLTTPNNRLVSVADKRDVASGAVTTANFVPAGATAVAANLTIVSATGSGFLTVNPGGVTTVDSSTINWSAPGQVLANGVILTLNTTRQLTVVCGGGGSTDFLIDVMGYYL